MKFGKRFFFAATALLMAVTLSLAACGGGNTEGDGGDGHDHVDRNGDGKCDMCGDPVGGGEGEGEGGHNHSYTLHYSDTQHWQECLCGVEKAGSREAHVDKDANRMCDVCEYYMQGSHVHSWTWKYKGDEHWQLCEEDNTEKNGSRGVHCDDDKNGKCDACGAPMKVEDEGGQDGEHTSHTFVWMRDERQHWQECSCGEKTEKAPHTQNANYRCECGYAYDAPAEGGLSSTNYWIVGTFTDNGGWGETHNDTWKFHRLVSKDTDGRTQYVFERAFKNGEEFKIVKDGGGYWDGEINAGHLSDSAKKLFDGNGGGNIRVIGGKGYYVITLHAGSGDPSVEAEMLYGEGNKPQPHEHSYSSAWETDENNHWHPSICEHTGLRKDSAAHSFVNGSYVCSVCGYEKPHEHVEGEEWVTNGTSHWKICTLCGRKLEETEGAHSGGPCAVCGYDVGIVDGLKLQYDKASGSYFVIGYDNDEIKADVRIPETYNERKVTKITNKAFMGCEKIHSVIIPDSITCIDIYSFCNCAFLESVTLGSGVREIGMAAFENCSALTDIKFPESLEKLGMSAFENTSITQFTVGKNLVEIGAFAFRTKKLDKVTFEVTAGWTVSNLPFSEESEAVDVSNAEKNALMFFYAKFQEDYPTTHEIIVKWAEEHGSDVLKFLSNYTWRRG